MADIAKQNLSELSLLSLEPEADMQGLFTTFIPRIGDTLRRSWQAIANHTSKERITGDTSRFMSLIGKETYLDLSSLIIECPEGLQTDYLTYSNALVAAVKFSTETQSKIVKDLRQHLSNLLNGNMLSYSPTGLEKGIINRIKDRELIEKEIKKCLDRSTNRKISYGVAINRNSDWTGVFENIEKMQMLDKHSRDQMRLDLEAINELIDAVVAKVSSPDNIRINKQAVKYTSELIYAVGEEAKFVAQTYTLTEALFERLSNGVDHIIRVLSKK